MRSWTMVAALVLAAAGLPTRAEAARCTGSASCRACSNCSRCAHCSSGGTCGVCAPKERSEPKPTPSPVKAASPAKAAPAAPPKIPEGCCTRVPRGDVLVVQHKGKPTPIQLRGVEVPSVSSYGRAATAIATNALQVSEGLAVNRQVRIEQESQPDRTTNLVSAMVYRASDGQFINKHLITQGLAFADLNGPLDPDLMEELRRAEDDAREKRRGMWAAIASAYESTAGKAPRAETWLKMGDTLRAKNAKAAEGWYRKAIEHYPHSEPAALARKRLGLPESKPPPLDSALAHQLLANSVAPIQVKVPYETPPPPPWETATGSTRR